MRASYQVDYYPGLTAEVFAVIDGQRQLVDAFSELPLALDYCRQGFASRGEKIHWHLSHDQGATVFSSQEIVVPDLDRYAPQVWQDSKTQGNVLGVEPDTRVECRSQGASRSDSISPETTPEGPSR